MSAPHPLPTSPEIPAFSGSKTGQKPSLRAAINRFCRSCLYDPGAGGAWREQVESCTATDCPLFAVRPTSKRRAANA